MRLKPGLSLADLQTAVTPLDNDVTNLASWSHFPATFGTPT
jgi:hypothetical protein